KIEDEFCFPKRSPFDGKPLRCWPSGAGKCDLAVVRVCACGKKTSVFFSAIRCTPD
uniref:Uncharacterized protein n=1 Tax=Anopheles quadriannulatus TaxID=34691 RepID=A0A182XTH5_ANOQN